MNEFLDSLLKGLLIAAGTAAPALIAWICSWVKTYIEAHVSNQYLKTLLLEADDAVAYVNQSMANDWKAAAEDGKLTDDEKAMLREKARLLLVERLKGLPARFLTEDRIKQAIEAAVGRNKLPDPPKAPTSQSHAGAWDEQTK